MIKFTVQFCADELGFNQLITHSGESSYVFHTKGNANVIGVFKQQQQQWAM